MSPFSPPTVVRLTPNGRGAIASLRVEGHGAVRCVARRFISGGGKSLDEVPDDRPVMGYFEFDDGHREQVVVVRRDDGSVTIHGHGGTVVAQRIEWTLEAEGCRRLDWRAWIDLVEPDKIRAAARKSLAEAATLRTAGILLDQYHGALTRAFRAVAETSDRVEAAQRVDRLLRFADVGLHLVRPWRVVVAGRVNVGKSSLVNALLGYQRVIVHVRPGTTRDLVTAVTAVDGWPIELVDTAGARGTGESSDMVERAGIERARDASTSAERLLLVFDRSQAWTSVDTRLIATHPRALVIHNKADLPAGGLDGRPEGICISAKTGAGIDRLLIALSKHLVPTPPEPGQAVPFTLEQCNQLVGR